METWTVYLLKCSNNSVYVGCTSNLEQRIKEHNSGKVKSTQYRIPVSVTTKITFNDKYKAYNFEKYLKTGSGRAFLNKRLL
ncbi:Predicted endonuclease, GIY-YIG superfamily [Salinimicrobium catena]|uniref:Predicted endonuclease, GIY-YIG superfamily n=1 Tax=Salinimicrobium catena TaxID=390640 RepID=A0A1H5NRW0_9FLAO|nr:GIY-YIG nuclease family protein [Salinimicrobium catena]SDL55505.1 Predicted endonuclease, GIY-YIG superfamily [Salinimicrobium catena]SEF03537.1 Predicted endonuclease, GIY-YIG superfamily [Salinimicrobium catena]